MGRLRWFVYVERKDDNNWVKCCITWEVEGIRQRGRPKKTWWDCVKNDMESLDLSWPVFIEAKDDGGVGDSWTTGAISRAKL